MRGEHDRGLLQTTLFNKGGGGGSDRVRGRDEVIKSDRG